jgi:hypothetical protein
MLWILEEANRTLSSALLVEKEGTQALQLLLSVLLD